MPRTLFPAASSVCATALPTCPVIPVTVNIVISLLSAVDDLLKRRLSHLWALQHLMLLRGSGFNPYRGMVRNTNLERPFGFVTALVTAVKLSGEQFVVEPHR